MGTLDPVVGDFTRELPPGLWDRLRLDPVHAPEHIALPSSRQFGPQAEHWVAERTSRYAVKPDDLAKMAKKRHAALARFEGAATGVGGVFTMVPDLVALAWIQSRLIFYIAAAYGYDPSDRMRPAEALVLFDFYPDPQAARRALDGVGSTIVSAYLGSQVKREEALVVRLTKLLGIRGARHLAGRMIPGAAIAFNSIGNERRTRALADKAIRYYGG